MNTALWVCVPVAIALLLAAGVMNGAPVRTGAAVELQTGPVILSLAAPEGPVRMIAERGCLERACPLIELRVRRGAGEAAAPVKLTVR